MRLHLWGLTNTVLQRCLGSEKPEKKESVAKADGSKVEARKLEHGCPHTLKVKYKGS